MFCCIWLRYISRDLFCLWHYFVLVINFTKPHWFRCCSQFFFFFEKNKEKQVQVVTDIKKKRKKKCTVYMWLFFIWWRVLIRVHSFVLSECLPFKASTCSPASFLNGREASFFFVDPQSNWLCPGHPRSNSSHLCVCPPVNTTAGITAPSNESSLCFLC